MADALKFLFGVAKTEIGYMWNSSENFRTFEDEIDMLNALKETLQQQIEAARHEGKRPRKDLENWMESADVKISKARKIKDDEGESNKTCCNLCFCVNLGNLYRYGKMATKETASLLKQRQTGERFKDYVFDPLPTPGFLECYQPKDLDNIDTQKSTLKTIVQAVKDIQIVGIIGLGGVGKTTLAKEASRKLKNQFDHIEFIAVSQDVIVEKIKEKAEVAGRKILSGEKVLIILDDVWKELKLDEVGIPCGCNYMNCKILLTSRNRDVCNAMNATAIELNPLQENEAWVLFEQVVGKREWDAKLKQVKLGIVEECGGLPLFLQAVGNALKDKEIKSWQAALDRLRDPLSDLMYKRKGISQLKLSYDYLTDEIAKSCFLLCSLFPEDADIDRKRLESYGLALGIFNNPNCSMQGAKHRVQTAIDTLNSSFLLLSEKKGTVDFIKMHDLVRDMAMVITSEGNDTFCVRSGKGLVEWQPENELQKHKISLMRNNICELPDHEFQFPQLDTFLIQDNELSIVHDDFFQHMTKLKVLDMAGNKISSLPRSLEQLKALCMLDLSSNTSLYEISILGKLTCLEILKLRETGITDIPGEIGKLAKLRVLDVWKCDLPFVSQGVISKLIKLEELYIWSTEDVNCSFLGELSNLQSLTILHLCIFKLEKIPENIRIETLIEFHFQNNEVNFLIDDGIRVLKISYISFPFEKPIIELIQASEALHLKGIKDSNEHGQRKTNRELSNLYSLEVLWDRPNRYTIFCNLVIIAIENFDSLSELFPVSVAEGLCQSEKNIYYGL